MTLKTSGLNARRHRRGRVLLLPSPSTAAPRLQQPHAARLGGVRAMASAGGLKAEVLKNNADNKVKTSTRASASETSCRCWCSRLRALAAADEVHSCAGDDLQQELLPLLLGGQVALCGDWRPRQGVQGQRDAAQPAVALACSSEAAGSWGSAQRAGTAGRGRQLSCEEQLAAKRQSLKSLKRRLWWLVRSPTAGARAGHAVQRRRAAVGGGGGLRAQHRAPGLHRRQARGRVRLAWRSLRTSKLSETEWSAAVTGQAAAAVAARLRGALATGRGADGALQHAHAGRPRPAAATTRWLQSPAASSRRCWRRRASPRPSSEAAQPAPAEP